MCITMHKYHHSVHRLSTPTGADVISMVPCDDNCILCVSNDGTLFVCHCNDVPYVQMFNWPSLCICNDISRHISTLSAKHGINFTMKDYKTVVVTFNGNVLSNILDPFLFLHYLSGSSPRPSLGIGAYVCVTSSLLWMCMATDSGWSCMIYNGDDDSTVSDDMPGCEIECICPMNDNSVMMMMTINGDQSTVMCRYDGKSISKTPVRSPACLSGGSDGLQRLSVILSQPNTTHVLSNVSRHAVLLSVLTKQEKKPDCITATISIQRYDEEHDLWNILEPCVLVVPSDNIWKYLGVSTDSIVFGLPASHSDGYTMFQIHNIDTGIDTVIPRQRAGPEIAMLVENSR